MSNRFSALNENSEYKKRGNDRKKDDDRHQNIFRQKPKQQPKNQRYIQKDKTSNQFRKQQLKTSTEFKIEKDNFPTLTNKTNNSNTSEDTQDTQELSYSEKIKKQKELQKEKTVLNGWIILTHKTIAELAAKPKIQTEPTNEYYNKHAAKLITESRRQYREELNDILGDISPYWDLPIAEDDEEDTDIEMEIYSEDEEQEYVDENW